jgi:hypothetical protein
MEQGDFIQPCSQLALGWRAVADGEIPLVLVRRVGGSRAPEGTYGNWRTGVVVTFLGETSSESVSADHLHYGARQVATRTLGSDSGEHVRIVYRWMTEVAVDQRPPFLIKIGRHVCAWESAIRKFSENG